jgi:hypothetical protein
MTIDEFKARYHAAGPVSSVIPEEVPKIERQLPQHYFKHNRPVLRKEYYFVRDLIDLYDAVQNDRCELWEFHVRIRQYARDAKVIPFTWMPADHLMHAKTSR